mmetsp:Transcript_39865/g.58563  ORF Transcript_39865/g.58563 Transcript_39865/m.58563 type:complete len:258 (-) Transcript_39865:1580-2353(-)
MMGVVGGGLVSSLVGDGVGFEGGGIRHDKAHGVEHRWYLCDFDFVALSAAEVHNGDAGVQTALGVDHDWRGVIGNDHERVVRDLTNVGSGGTQGSEYVGGAEGNIEVDIESEVLLRLVVVASITALRDRSQHLQQFGSAHQIAVALFGRCQAAHGLYCVLHRPLSTQRVANVVSWSHVLFDVSLRPHAAHHGSQGELQYLLVASHGHASAGVLGVVRQHASPQRGELRSVQRIQERHDAPTFGKVLEVIQCRVGAER